MPVPISLYRCRLCLGQTHELHADCFRHVTENTLANDLDNSECPKYHEWLFEKDLYHAFR